MGQSIRARSKISCKNDRDQKIIGRFRVPKTLTLKKRLSAPPFLWKSVLLCMRIKLNLFHINGFALSLALKPRFGATRKWLIIEHSWRRHAYDNGCTFFGVALLSWVILLRLRIESLSNDDGEGNEDGKKAKRFRSAKQQLSTCITFFCTFLCRCCTTTMWNCLIARFVEDVNTRQRLSFSFPELWYSLLEFNSRKICQQLMNWMSWNKCDKVWSSMNSLFKRSFRCRLRRCC